MMSILTPLSLYTQNVSRDGDAEGTTAPEVFSEVPFQTYDRLARAIVSRATAGLSPAAVALAFMDWAMHLTLSPGKQLDLVCQAAEGAIGNLAFAARSASGADQDPCGSALPQERILAMIVSVEPSPGFLCRLDREHCRLPSTSIGWLSALLKQRR